MKINLEKKPLERGVKMRIKPKWMNIRTSFSTLYMPGIQKYSILKMGLLIRELRLSTKIC